MAGLAQAQRPTVAQEPPAEAGHEGHDHAHDHRRSDRQGRYGNSFIASQLPATGEAHEAPGTARPPPGGGTEQATEPGQLMRGMLSQVQKLKSPLPPVAGEQRRELFGMIILGRGVSPTALDACEAIVRATLGARKDVQERMRKAKAALVIVPSQQKMTEVEEFKALKGTKTFDGRTWDDVRGAGGMRVPSGLFAIAVPEENLVETGNDAYSDGYSVGLHELAHAIHDKGLPPGEQEQVLALYNARKAAGGPWTEDYGASNEWEYYAQATNCYYGANDGIGHNGPGWLKKNDPGIYALLERVYGPPPVGPDAPAP